MTSESSGSLHRVATLPELRAKGVIVVAGKDRPIAVFYHEGGIAAVDNRCPHMGFPLHTGSVKDGLLTCHWHEARFDLCDGCTFDLWADDVPSFDTEVDDGIVYVREVPRTREDASYHLCRLLHGLAHGIPLIQAKAILGLRRMGVDWPEIVKEIALFGSRHHDDWNQGMTLLAVTGNLAPHLSERTMFHLLMRASRQVAVDCSDAVPHRLCAPLTGDGRSPEQLVRWMRNWVKCRHRDGAERVLLTAAAGYGDSDKLATLVFAAASDRAYADVGHVFDFSVKSFELLDTIGWTHAPNVLPLVLQRMVSARGAEESAHWHHPIELIEPLRSAERQLPQWLDEGKSQHWTGSTGLEDVLLGDDPIEIINLLGDAIRHGAPPAELSKRVAYAAAQRLARFATTNEIADWFAPRHTLIFANAVHRAVKRCGSADVVRGVFHAAISVYMDRFLNIPPAKLPDATPGLDSLPEKPDDLLSSLLQTLDTQSSVTEAAMIVARYVRRGHRSQAMVDALAFAAAREDFDFHALQVLEAGVQQASEWDDPQRHEWILVAVVRQLAAFCPTPRAGYQTATIALRLDRGDKIYDDSDYMAAR